VNIKNHIPNAITSMNLVCGCLGIIAVLTRVDGLIVAGYCIAGAAIFDFFDGFAARLLGVHSEMGKQLDSLADMVTFGVLPGLILFVMIHHAENAMANFQWPYLYFVSLFIPVFSALRLAKFNIDPRQSEVFIGLPTPANSLLVGSLPFCGISNFHPFFLAGLSILMSFLLVAELPLFALKFKSFGWKKNEVRYSFIIGAAISIFIFQIVALPFIILAYILLSWMLNLLKKG